MGGLYEVTTPGGTAANTQVRAFVNTPSGRTAVLQFSATGTNTGTLYLIQDQLGSTSLVTDERGALRERFSYDAWGAPRDPSTAVNGAWPTRTATTRGFTDHEMLTGVQLVHMNGRVYDPALGRFLSPDPVVSEADGTQAYNRYAYVRNNPLSLTDPTGYVGEEAAQPPLHVPGITVTAPRYTPPPFPTFSLPAFVPGLSIVANQSSGTYSQAAQNSLSPADGSLMWHSAMVGFAPADVNLDDEESGVGLPGFGGSIVPFYGAGRTSIHYYQNGRWVWGTVNAGLAISDVFLVRSILTGGGKLIFKGGSKLLGRDAAEGTGGGARRLNIFGQGEARGFLDVSTNARFANGRPLTSTLADGSASNIFIRNAPVTGQNTLSEIVRLSRPGTKITLMQPTSGFQGQTLLNAFGGRATVDFTSAFTSRTVAPGVDMSLLRIVIGSGP